MQPNALPMLYREIYTKISTVLQNSVGAEWSKDELVQELFRPNEA